MSFGFPAGEEPKDHDWRFVGMDLEAGAVSRFQCQRCGRWMSRRETKSGAKVLYYSVEFPNQWKPLERRPLCKRRGRRCLTKHCVYRSWGWRSIS